MLEVAQQGVFGAALGLAGGLALVAILNRTTDARRAAPALRRHRRHPDLCRGASLRGGSGLLAVYVAGLVVANRPTRAYPSIVGFHDAVTWLCQIVMFLVLGLLVTPTTLWHFAWQGVLIALVLTFVARPLAVWLCLSPFGFAGNEKLFVSWVGPARGGLDLPRRHPDPRRRPRTRRIYFNIAFFVVLLSLLVQGSTLTTAARRLGVALRQVTHKSSRVEIDIPGQTEQEIVGYPVTADTVVLGLHRLPAWARVIMVVRKGHILEPSEALPLQGRRLRLLPGRPRAADAPRQPVPRAAATFPAGSGSCSASCRSAARPGSAKSSSSTTSTSASTPATSASPTGPPSD